MLCMNLAAREARLRRLACKNDLQLAKSRRWADAGCYALIDPNRNALVFGEGVNGFGATLDEVEDWLLA